MTDLLALSEDKSVIHICRHCVLCQELHQLFWTGFMSVADVT